MDETFMDAIRQAEWSKVGDNVRRLFLILRLFFGSLNESIAIRVLVRSVGDIRQQRGKFRN